MFWDLLDGDEPDEKVPSCYPDRFDISSEEFVPAWSLSALVNIMPSKMGDSVNKIIKSELQKKYFCVYSLKLKSIKETYGDTAVDAAFEMVCWLLENGHIKAGKVSERHFAKFKEGDWINGYYTNYKVLSVNNDGYIVKDVDGSKINILFENEKFHHLWTIKDAKDGDVLCSNQLIILFKQFEDNADCNFVIAHAGIDISGKLQITNGHWLISNKSKPATKEQRDTLEKAMADAGWEFDFKKKELKKIEQKSTWSEEGKKYENIIVSILNNPNSEGIYNFHEVKCKDVIDWFKSLKDRVQPQLKQEWKQKNTDDLTDFENAMMHIGGSFFGENAGLDPNDTNAIKEQANLLLELVPKQEWSEKDERILRTIEGDIKQNLSCCTTTLDDYYQKQLDWLKTLKNRVGCEVNCTTTWKPSDEQMNAFDAVLVYNPPCSNECRNHLITLYNELKKLKE